MNTNQDYSGFLPKAVCNLENPQTKAVLQRLTETFGIRIDRLADVSAGIFDICNQTSWDVLADSIPVFEFSEHDCLITTKSHDIPINNPVIVCPLEQLITALEDNLVRSPRSSNNESLTPVTKLRPIRESQGHLL